MATKKNLESSFVDPLKNIDPVMEKAFSTYQDEPSKGAPIVSEIQFPDLKETSGSRIQDGVFNQISVQLAVELGRTKISLKDVYELNEGSIIELDRLVGEPLDIVINNQVIGQGEVVAIDHHYGIRITHIVSRI